MALASGWAHLLRQHLVRRSTSILLPQVQVQQQQRERLCTYGPPEQSAYTLFVGGLASSVDSESLRRAFAKFPSMVKATIVTERESGRSRGFGFVTFRVTADAEAAKKTMNGEILNGRPLRVIPANKVVNSGPRSYLQKPKEHLGSDIYDDF